jgi:hypothetical protein
MAVNRRDVNLVIRAKDEAGKAFESAASALEKLLATNTAVGASAQKTGERLRELAATGAALDRAYAQITRSADGAEAAFARQQASLAEQRSQLAALVGQSEAAARAIARLKSADAIVDAGRDQSGRITQLRFLEQQYDRLEAQQSKLRTAIASGEDALDRQRSALQQVGSTAIAAERAQADLTRQIEAETRALVRQTAAAERNARVLETVNRATGVSRDTTELSALNAQIAAQNERIEKLREEQRAQAALADIEDARRRAQSLLPGNAVTGKSARESAAVFQEADIAANRAFEQSVRGAAAAERELADATARLKAQIDPLAVIQNRLNRELQEAAALYRAGRITSIELAQAQQLLAANAEKARRALDGSGLQGTKPTLFGLTPYAVTNLGYQINDIVTQIASGTSVTQTLAQQGGQILQIFPQAGGAIVGALSNPLVLAFAASVGASVLALRQLNEEASRLRGFEALLSATAGGAEEQAVALAASAKALDLYGLSAEDAVKVTRQLFRDGIDVDQIDDLGIAAKNVADVLGIEVTDAARQLTEALTGGFSAFQRLDRQLNLTTETQRAYIRQLYDEGRAQEARRVILQQVTSVYQDAADRQRGSWSEAARSLDNAWNGLLTRLGNTGPIRGAAQAISDLADTVERLVSGGSNLNEVNVEIRTTQAAIRVTENQIAEIQNSAFRGSAFNIARLAALRGELSRYNRELETQLARREELRALDRNNGGDPLAQGTEAQARATSSLTSATARLRAEQSGASAEQRIAAAEAEAAAQAQIDLQSESYRLATDAVKQEYVRERVAQARRRVEEQITAENRRQADEQERLNREAQSGVAQARRLIQAFEGFRRSAYYDVNAFRVGFGSDTTTAPDGTVRPVTRATTVDRAGAERDLERRIVEFQDTIKRQIGADRFSAFSPEQQAALTSIAYNYGSLPERILQAVRTGTAQEIATAVRGLGGDNNGINRDRRNREASILESPNVSLAQSTINLEQDRLEAQARFNALIEDENEKRRLAIQTLEEQRGLTGEALLAVQRRQEVAAAVLQLEQQIDRANAQRRDQGLEEIAITQQQRDAVAELAGQYFDLSRARDAASAPLDAIQRDIDALRAQSQALEQAIQFQQSQGNSPAAEQLRQQLMDVNQALTMATTAAIEMWTAIAADPAQLTTLGRTREEVEALILSLTNGLPAVQNLERQFIQTGDEINRSFAQLGASALDRFAQSIAEGQNVLGAFRDSFLSFVGEFLRGLAQMIAQQAIFNAIQGAVGGGGKGAGGSIASFISRLFHSGGVVGSAGGQSRRISPAWFTNAPRFHGGGLPGLKSNEVAAVLERGEEVLTADDPRHVANGGKSGGATTVVNVFDPADFLDRALAGNGSRILLNFVGANSQAFKAALG